MPGEYPATRAVTPEVIDRIARTGANPTHIPIQSPFSADFPHLVILERSGVARYAAARIDDEIGDKRFVDLSP